MISTRRRAVKPGRPLARTHGLGEPEASQQTLSAVRPPRPFATGTRSSRALGSERVHHSYRHHTARRAAPWAFSVLEVRTEQARPDAAGSFIGGRCGEDVAPTRRLDRRSGCLSRPARGLEYRDDLPGHPTASEPEQRPHESPPQFHLCSSRDHSLNPLGCETQLLLLRFGPQLEADALLVEIEGCVNPGASVSHSDRQRTLTPRAQLKPRPRREVLLDVNPANLKRGGVGRKDAPRGLLHGFEQRLLVRFQWSCCSAMDVHIPRLGARLDRFHCPRGSTACRLEVVVTQDMGRLGQGSRTSPDGIQFLCRRVRCGLLVAGWRSIAQTRWVGIKLETEQRSSEVEVGWGSVAGCGGEGETAVCDRRNATEIMERANESVPKRLSFALVGAVAFVSVLAFLTGLPSAGAARARSLSWPLPLPVRVVVFSPDGRTLASAGKDGAVRLWDMGTRTQVGAPIGAPNPHSHGASSPQVSRRG